MRDGLSDAEAGERLTRFGPNTLARAARPRYGAIAARQVADPLVALLVAAAGVSFAIGELVEAVVIAAIVVLNGALGFVQELGAERAVIALREAAQPQASVIRSGRERELPAAEVVPGDLIVLREGERVPADARLVQAEGLAVDESLLTGESIAEEKTPDAVPAETLLADRTSVVFAGTAVTRGRGAALVTVTGARTEIGGVVGLAARAKPPPTPLQRRLGHLTRAMVAIGLAITVLLAAIRLLQGAPLEKAFLLGVSVAVAAVPEGLAATVTIALALGARRIAGRGAIVRRLPAVETLGSATVIASDKTGTLTENRLRLTALAPAPGRREEDLLRAAMLASTAQLLDGDEGRTRVKGDPLEGAILLAARQRGLEPAGVRAGATVVRELPFDPERRRMTLVCRERDGLCAYAKGAPETLLGDSRAPTAERQAAAAQAAAWAGEGLRVLAVTQRALAAAEASAEAIERGHELVGLLALEDPLRPSAAVAVREARAAGLGVRILTGDHPATADAIARRLGLPADAVRARVTPGEKLQLVTALQRDGEVVAVTGDGVNDAPALRRADIGVAMGRSGTEAARSASDVVLTDDDFSTIVAAIREGRGIADNVRKFVAFLLSANLGEVLLFAIAVLAGLGVPLTVVQVLTVNVLTDGLPAVALARDPVDEGVMRRPPERSDDLFSAPGWLALGLVRTAVAAAALGAFLIGRASGDDAARTMAFATLALGELVLVFAIRSPFRAAWHEPRNRMLLIAVAGSAALVALALFAAPLREPFGTTALEPLQVAAVLALALTPATVVEAGKTLVRARAGRRGRARVGTRMTDRGPTR